MIDPNAISTVRVGQLVEEIWSGTDNLAHEVGTDLKRGTVADLATYIQGIIEGSAGLAFNPLSISNGQTLPITTVSEWIIVGAGTYLQTGGFSDVVCTEEINIVLSNGTSWSFGFGIAIDGIDTSQFVKLTTNQTIEGVKTFVSSPIVPTATTANQAVNFGQMNLQSVLDGGNLSTKGVEISEVGENAITGISMDATGVIGYSEFSTASLFDIGASNTNNITQFRKNGNIVSAITHEGKIIGTDATEPNQMVTLGQLNDVSIPYTGTTRPITGDLEFANNKALRSIILDEDIGLYTDNSILLSSLGMFLNSTNLSTLGMTSIQLAYNFIEINTDQNDFQFRGSFEFSNDGSDRKIYPQTGWVLDRLDTKAPKANPTFTGSVQVPNATASNEAVNFSQLANENNVYLSHDFLTNNQNDFVSIANVNSGTFTTSNANLTANNAGILRITSSTTANSGVAIRSTSNTFILKGGEIFTEIFNPLTFTNTTSRMGIHDSTSSAVPANGVFFRYSGDGLLTLVTADNSVQTTSATIATLSLNTWYKVRFTVNANATSVLGELFDASGTLIASVTQTTNIPTTARRLNLCSITTNSGTTATALLDVDFISLKTTLTR